MIGIDAAINTNNYYLCPQGNDGSGGRGWGQFCYKNVSSPFGKLLSSKPEVGIILKTHKC